MIEPVIYDNLFEINDDLVPKFKDGIIVIDNFYKNFDEIYSMLSNMKVNRWKASKDSRNFIDYYDCRLSIKNANFSEKYKKKIQFLMQLIGDYYKEVELEIMSPNYSFNYYKNLLKGVPNNLQHFPHVDFAYNALVTFDKVCSGGTAIYHSIKNLENTEEDNLLYDISDLDAIIIPAKQNRLIIFNGSFYHGGYIENHDAYTGENWRINQVMFFNEINSRTE
jgi:hypothetical protein